MKAGKRELEKYLDWALKNGAHDAVMVDPRTVVTAPWVRLKCQFGCYKYGLSHCCPPYTPTHEATRLLLDTYKVAILLHKHVGPDPFEGMKETPVDLERVLFLDGYYKAWAMGHGGCKRCKKCNLPSPCAHPERARPSMEACGIDVYATARAVGLPLEVVRTHSDERECYGLVLVE